MEAMLRSSQELFYKAWWEKSQKTMHSRENGSRGTWDRVDRQLCQKFCCQRGEKNGAVAVQGSGTKGKNLLFNLLKQIRTLLEMMQ